MKSCVDWPCQTEPPGWPFFAFHSTEDRSSFRCSLDGHPYVACTTPFTYAGLGSGDHSFLVAAVDDAGNPDLSPSAYTWMVEGSVPSPPGSLTATGAIMPWR